MIHTKTYVCIKKGNFILLHYHLTHIYDLITANIFGLICQFIDSTFKYRFAHSDLQVLNVIQIKRKMAKMHFFCCILYEKSINLTINSTYCCINASQCSVLTICYFILLYAIYIF